MRAYVLIQTETGTELIANELREVPGVVSAEDVTGAYDAIAVARSGSMRHLMEVILPEIRRLPGVTRALPAPLLDGWEPDRETEPAGDDSRAVHQAA
ncbi:MAG TPA: Lrp/AsnC ligand binding domain-containing protein [Actinomycetota bacterium]|nr:Lrp/AsnC ligand binding domain-containing protein [Actinomycetota bacterium]